jgi:hypothetical protein
MLKNLTFVALLLFTVPAQKDGTLPQEGKSTTAPPPKSEPERKAEKEAGKQRDREAGIEERERLRQPPQIQIKATMERVSAILIRHMNERGYSLAEEDRYRLVFQKEVTNFGARVAGDMMGGDSPPLWTVSYTLTELSGETVISADMAVIVRKRFGTAARTDKNKDKQSRRDLDALLHQVRYESEAQ